ncbi:MAG: hypothetical protein NZM25_00605 [Leptospiraceae bacterium]|nr:hypothetical protein [Leptospiraceae bacterium]MDW8306225.1 hypothetical protein [Leptospiraceae bacterium]
MRLVLRVIFTLIVSKAIWAKPFTVGNATCLNNTAVCTSLLGSINQQLKDVENLVNKNLPDVDAKRFAQGMGNAMALATKGQMVDYGSNIKFGLLGVGAGVAMDPGEGRPFAQGKHLPAGFGGQASLLLGFNLGLLPLPKIGPVDPKRGILFFNFFAANLPKIPTQELDYEGSVFNLGAHVRYNIVERYSVAFGLFEWTGIDVTSGLNYSSFDLTLKYKVNEAFDYDLGSGSSMKGTYATTFRLGPDIGVFNIPLEASTGVKFLWIFRVYGGLGLDFNLGSSEIALRAPGELKADIYQGTTKVDEIQAPTTLNLGGTSSPDFLVLRGFGGVQLDFAVLNIFLQYNLGFTSNTYGITYGLRAYF